MIKLEEIAFKNFLGDVINVGDEVIFIASSYKTIYIKNGIYLGMNGRRVVLEVDDRRIVREDDSYRKYHHEDYKRRSHLHDNCVFLKSTPLAALVGSSF